MTKVLPLDVNTTPPAIVARRCAFAYVALIVLGVIVFRLPGAMIAGNEMSFERSVFTVVNAATLTGFQQAVPLDEYGISGQICIVVLTIAGTLLSLIIGGIAISRALRRDDSPAQIVWATLFTFVFCVGIGTAMMLERERGLIDSATQAMSAFGNSGLYLGKLPGITEWRTHAALLPLVLVGGLSIPVLQELTDSIFARRKWSSHTLIVLSWLAGVYIVGLIVLTPWGLHGEIGGVDLSTAVATGSSFSINARTCGLPIASAANLSRVAQWILIVFMSIGAAPGSVTGGFKVTSLYHGWRSVRGLLRGQRTDRIDALGLIWLLGYAGVLFLIFLGLLATLPEMAADRLAFLASSAMANCGLSHEPVVLTGGGLWVTVIAMLVGRAAALGVVWWMCTAIPDPKD